MTYAPTPQGGVDKCSGIRCRRAASGVESCFDTFALLPLLQSGGIEAQDQGLRESSSSIKLASIPQIFPDNTRTL